MDARALRLTLAAAILGSGIVFLDSTVVNVALPALREDLGADLATQQWVVESYLLTLGALLLVGGSLGDLYGRRRVFRAGLIGFGATSLLCAIAPSGELLVVARALQGFAGALLVPGSLALITASFPADRRAAAIGSWTAWTGIAFVVGPLGGGALIDLASWRWIFAINIPLVLVCLALVRAGVPESGGARDGLRRVDAVGAVLCVLGLAGPVLALIEQPQHGWSDPLVLVPLVAGVVLLAAFLVWERRAAHPMLPLGLFRSRNFAVGNLTTLALYAGLGAATLYVAIFLQQVGGYGATAAGMALMPITLVMFVLARRFGALASRIGPRFLMGAGPVVAGSGLLLLSRLPADVDYVRDVLPGVLVFAVGLSATVAPLTATVLAAVGDEHAGVASGANNAISRVAALLAVAAVGAVIAASYGAALPADARYDAVRDRPLSGGTAAVEAASVKGFAAGLRAAAALVALGGLVSLVGIVNSPRRARSA